MSITSLANSLLVGALTGGCSCAKPIAPLSSSSSGTSPGSEPIYGAAAGAKFNFTVDQTPATTVINNAGDPFAAGPGTSYRLSLYGVTNDLYFGIGTGNSLSMGNGKRAFLFHELSGTGEDIVRLHNIQTIVGGTGNQYIDLTSATISYGDIKVIGGSGHDVILSNAGNDWLLGGNGNDTLWGGSGNDKLEGQSGNDNLNGGIGDDWIDGGTGNDKMAGGAGNDVYVVNAVADAITESAGEGSDTIYASITMKLGDNVENLILTGTSALAGTGNALDNELTGNSAANTLTGGDGNDRLDGGAGNDKLTGGKGDDIYIVGSTKDVVIEAAGEGNDKVFSSVTYTLTANVEGLTLTGTAAINATGNASDNTLTGNNAANTLSGGDGNDRLDGAAGNDTLIGGAGDDTYVVDSAADAVVESLNSGIDTVLTSFTYTLGTNTENLTLTGTAAVDGTGNGLDNVITGNSAANRLDGAAGNDTLIGGAGDDTYVVDSAADAVVESLNSGIDTVLASFTYTLGTNTENLTLTGTAAVDGTGNGLDNVITGNSAANRLDGAAGNDTLIGGAGDDTYIVDSANDLLVENGGEGLDLVISTIAAALLANFENLTLAGNGAIDGTGNALANVITGNSAANRLDGGAGADTLIGGAGDDTYFIDDAGDLVIEGAGGGLDHVIAVISSTLTENAENLTLAGTAAIEGTGNSFDNVITGNDAANILDGGAGNDTLIGGGGNDTYIVDSAGDSIVESADGGIDTVRTSVSMTVSAGIETVILTGSGSISITGTSADNTITGNGGDNIIDGKDGNDIISGGAGNDTVYGSDGKDTLAGVEGHDTLDGGAGNDTLSGGSGNDILLGGTGNDGLIGGGGNDSMYGGDGIDSIVGDGGSDWIWGGAGNDKLAGGAQADTFFWQFADVRTEAGASAGFDTILDFTAGDILNFSAVFAGLPAASIYDCIHVRDATSGTIISLSTDGGITFHDAVSLSNQHFTTLDGLLGTGSIVA